MKVWWQAVTQTAESTIISQTLYQPPCTNDASFTDIPQATLSSYSSPLIIRLWNRIFIKVVHPPSWCSTIRQNKIVPLILPSYLFIYLSIPSNQPWCRFKYKKLLVWENRQEYPKFEINFLVTITHHLWIFHRMHWLFTVFLR